MNRPAQLAHHLQQIRSAIDGACQTGRQNPQDVHIMAVTKYACDEDVLALLKTGQIKHIGESRVQQATLRWTQPVFAKYAVTKHFIGHLQTNKAAQAVALFDFIDSVDSLRLAQVLDACASKTCKPISVLIQIKLTERESQSGVALHQAPVLLKQLQALKYIKPCGYMAIAPQTPDSSLLRALFRQVRNAFERDFPPQQGPRYLSLGMSNDFEIAVQEGSTLPRIGSRLFANLEEV